MAKLRSLKAKAGWPKKYKNLDQQSLDALRRELSAKKYATIAEAAILFDVPLKSMSRWVREEYAIISKEINRRYLVDLDSVRNFLFSCRAGIKIKKKRSNKKVTPYKGFSASYKSGVAKSYAEKQEKFIKSLEQKIVKKVEIAVKKKLKKK